MVSFFFAGFREGEGKGERWTYRSDNRGDVQDEIKHSILHEQRHVPVDLPGLRRMVHLNRVFEGWDDSEDQQYSTENKSGY